MSDAYAGDFNRIITALEKIADHLSSIDAELEDLTGFLYAVKKKDVEVIQEGLKE